MPDSANLIYSPFLLFVAAPERCKAVQTAQCMWFLAAAHRGMTAANGVAVMLCERSW